MLYAGQTGKFIFDVFFFSLIFRLFSFNFSLTNENNFAINHQMNAKNEKLEGIVFCLKFTLCPLIMCVHIYTYEIGAD